MVYQWRDGFRMHGNPQIVGEALDRLRKKHGGTVTPKDVLSEAEGSRSVLHSFFEWDDSAAAEKYRESQAGYLLRAVVVCASAKDPAFRPVRAFVCIDSGGGSDSEEVFTHILSAVRNDGYRNQVLARARAELIAWRQRYKDLEAFAGVFAAIDKALAG